MNNCLMCGKPLPPPRQRRYCPDPDGKSRSRCALDAKNEYHINRMITDPEYRARHNAHSLKWARENPEHAKRNQAEWYQRHRRAICARNRSRYRMRKMKDGLIPVDSGRKGVL